MTVLSLQCSVDAPPTPSKCTVLTDQLPTLTIAFFFKGQWLSGAQWAQHSQQAMKPQVQSPGLQNQEPLLSLPFCLTLRSKPTLVPQ